MENILCDALGIEFPIIQEPIHTLTNGKMIASISEAGMLGILGINSGYKAKSDTTTGPSVVEGDIIGDPNNFSILDTMTERNLMNEQIDSALSNTFRPFAVEIASSADSPEKDPIADAILQLMRKRRITITLFENFRSDLSKQWIDSIHTNGIKILYKVYSVEEAKTAIEKGIDVIICMNINNLSSIVNVAKGNTPIVLRSSNLNWALEHGANGIFLSTPFLVLKNAPTSANIKQAIINHKNSDLTTFTFPNHVVNSLKGALPDKLTQFEKKGKSSDEIWHLANKFQGLINGMAKGDLINGYTDICDIDKIDHELTAEEIADQLIHNN